MWEARDTEAEHFGRLDTEGIEGFATPLKPQKAISKDDI